jgi:hypothetical protein
LMFSIGLSSSSSGESCSKKEKTSGGSGTAINELV